MRESFVKGAQAPEAVREGFSESGRVVAAAALIMISVFGSFVITNDLITKSIGLSLAVGVAIDAFVVRMTLVPAVMSMLGKRAWWIPRWLAHALPEIDLDGANLDTPAAVATTPSAQATATP